MTLSCPDCLRTDTEWVPYKFKRIRVEGVGWCVLWKHRCGGVVGKPEAEASVV